MNNKWTHVVFMVLIAVVCFLIFFKTLKNDFTADDWRLIYEQKGFLKDWSNLSIVLVSPFPAETYEPIPFYRPMITLVNFINFHLLGQSTWTYRIVNLGFHIFNVILLYLLVFILFKRELLSLFTALFFAAHPIHTNSVVWISGRTDVIACFFVLLTVILFIKSRDHTGRARFFLFWGSVLTYLFSLFSKETTLALPLFLFVWGYLSKKEQLNIAPEPVSDLATNPQGDLGENSFKKKIIPYIPFVVVSILYLVLRVAVLGNLGSGKPYTPANVFQRFLTVFPIYFYYFKKFIFPLYLNFSPRVLTIMSLFSLKFWGSLIFFAVVLALGLSLRRSAKEVSYGIFWILITLIPVLNLVPLYASVKEWWAYIPSIGFCLIMGRLAELGVSWEKRLLEIRLPKRKLKEEKPSEAVPTITAEVSPPREEIMPESVVTIPEEISVEAKEGFLTKILGLPKRIRFPEKILIKGGHALALFFALLLIFYAFALQSRARIFRKDYHLWTNTSKIAPYDAIAHNAKGVILKRKGVNRWAKMAFEKAVEADPNFAEARNNYGSVLEMSSQDDSALVQLKEALRLKPNYAEAYNNLGIVYGKKMIYDSALVAFQRALELDSTHFYACKNIALIYADMQDFPKALRYYEKAMTLAPSAEEVAAIKQEINQIRVRGYR